MPELIEVEIYRRQAESLVGRTVAAVDAPDGWFLKGATNAATISAALTGLRVSAARRIGKLLLLDLTSSDSSAAGRSDDGCTGAGSLDAGWSDPGCSHPGCSDPGCSEAGSCQVDQTLGLRFGMTGRLVVDGKADVAELLYSSNKADPRFVRFGLTFDDGGEMSMVDPRRLGGVELWPDVERLGPDAATLTARELRLALARSTVSVKARLLDQSRVAGVGNLIADETFWRAGVDPTRSCASFDDAEAAELARRVRSTIKLLTKRGGSHTGDLQDERHRDGHCPRDGAPLRRDEIGGRTTYWCPMHQV